MLAPVALETSVFRSIDPLTLRRKGTRHGLKMNGGGKVGRVEGASFFLWDGCHGGVWNLIGLVEVKAF